MDAVFHLLPVIFYQLESVKRSQERGIDSVLAFVALAEWAAGAFAEE
jgi:hypothetical protein